MFKFPQMDFEMAIWEMTSLLIAPKKVFKSIYYHVCLFPCFQHTSLTWPIRNVGVVIRSALPLPIHLSGILTGWIETKNTWHRPDPSFTYLLSFFLLLTSLAWGLAYSPSFGAILRLSLLFVFVHFIGSSLLISTIAYFTVGRLFGPNGAAASLTGFRGSRGRRRGAAQGLFVQPGEKDQLEYGYCFDVCISQAHDVRWAPLTRVRFRIAHFSPSTSTFTSFSSCCCLSSPAARAIS